MKYRSEIDGLRAFAVIPVIFFHAGFLGLGGGFLGVDVFFTISGFLITSIILDDLDKGQFSLSHFYVRRIKRILPSLFVVLTCSTIAALLLFTPVFLKSYSESLMAVSTFSSNIFFWLTGGYFDIASELKPLLHTWSLAVEEQYYIFFPLGLMLLWRTGKEKLFILVLLGTVFSLGLSHWCAYHKPGANFFLLPMRMWQILLGSSIAFYTNMHGGIKTSPLQAQCLSFLGILLILSSYMFLDEKTPLPSLYALMPTLGTGLIIMFADTRTLANKILSNRFVVGIGLISYSAYLWHQPLFVFARYKLEAPSLMLMSGLGVLSLILASITWYYVEKPCRRKNNASKKMIFLLAFVGLSVFFLIGLAGHFSRGFESFYYNVRLTSQQKEMYLFVKKNTDYRLLDTLIDNGECHFWREGVDENIVQRFQSCYKKYGKAVVVLGDSHAMNLYNIVVKANYYPFVFGVVRGGCRAYENLPECHYKGFDKFLDQHANEIGYILFHQSGSHLIKDEHGKYGAQSVFEGNVSYSFDVAYIDSLIEYAQSLNKKVVTYWMGPYVESRFDVKLEKNILSGDFRMPASSPKIFEELERSILQEINKKNSLPNSNYLSLIEWMGIQDRSLIVENCLIYKDPDHLSRCGEGYWAEKLRARFEELHRLNGFTLPRRGV